MSEKQKTESNEKFFLNAERYYSYINKFGRGEKWTMDKYNKFQEKCDELGIGNGHDFKERLVF